MKIVTPTKEDVGTWMTFMTVCCAGVLAGKHPFIEWLWPAVIAWCGFAVLILLFLTVRASIRQRRDIADQ